MPVDKESKIRFGIELKDFLITDCGHLVEQMIRTQIALMCADALTKKEQKDDRKGQFTYQSIEQIERCRGFVMGLQWLLDEFLSATNFAEREEQKNKQKQL